MSVTTQGQTRRCPKMVNGLELYSAFQPQWFNKAFYSVSLIHKDTERPMVTKAAIQGGDHWKQLHLQCLAQGHFNTWKSLIGSD